MFIVRKEMSEFNGRQTSVYPLKFFQTKEEMDRWVDTDLYEQTEFLKRSCWYHRLWEDEKVKWKKDIWTPEKENSKGYYLKLNLKHYTFFYCTDFNKYTVDYQKEWNNLLDDKNSRGINLSYIYEEVNDANFNGYQPHVMDNPEW